MACGSGSRAMAFAPAWAMTMELGLAAMPSSMTRLPAMSPHRRSSASSATLAPYQMLMAHSVARWARVARWMTGPCRAVASLVRT